MNTNEYKNCVKKLPFGKRVGRAVYVYRPAFFNPAIPLELRRFVIDIIDTCCIPEKFNMIKFDTGDMKISFLQYPRFEQDPHPALTSYIIYERGDGDKSDSLGSERMVSKTNPPILHRKELFIPEDHPLYKKFANLTKQEEVLGLYEDTSRIGMKNYWDALLEKKEITLRGHRVVLKERIAELEGEV